MIQEIPILRKGVPYESMETVDIVHHATGEPVARVSIANSGLIARDVHRMNDRALERFTVAELLAMCHKAADLFVNAGLPLGNALQTFEDYIQHLSATTGMPVSYCRTNAEKIRRVLAEMDLVVAGLTRGFDLSILDAGHGVHDGRMLSFHRAGRVFGAVLPSNSPGVHGLWLPAVALKSPIVLKPGREEPWTPYRIVAALTAAGMPADAFGLYPTDHAGAGELLRCADRSMLFGDTSTTRPWSNDPRVEIHGPGFSKVILGEDAADHWPDHIDVLASSIAANCGRSCINASGVWTPRHGPAIADALADRFAAVEALPADNPNAQVAAFAKPAVAERISTIIDHELRQPGATDVTEKRRGKPRLVQHGRTAFLLPTIVHCADRSHTLVNREFLFPFASVVECPSDAMAGTLGSTLVATVISQDPGLIQSLMQCPTVDRLNIGAIPTWKLSWDQPHEGNLFEHLYRQRAFQIEPAA